MTLRRLDPRRHPFQRARLRNRIVVRVGLLVAALATTVGAATYYVIRDTLIEEQERSATEQFATNARVLSSALRTSDLDEVSLLAALRPEVRAGELLFVDGEWFTASLQIQPDDLPRPLVRAVRDGQPSVQRFHTDDGLALGLGAPLGGDHGLYYEVFSLDDLEDTLATLRNTLLATGTIATGLGLLIGWWIARRVTRPLEQVSAAAVSIAAGDLDTRLDGTADEDLARISSSFNRMADSLQARIARESRFAADVSHELRSPLTTLVNAMAVLEHRRAELSADGQEALDLLAADLKRFERMVADLIEISKHDAGTIRTDDEELPLGHVLSSVLRRSGREGLPLDVSSSDAELVVRLDPQRFERALGNIVENAEAYGGGVEAIVVDADETHVRVMVDDRGPGVPEDERDHIFERFSRGVHGERRTTADGSGLGLSLARENIRLCDGRVWVEENPVGRGARFVIELPRAEA